jgi:hypothetical protein
MINVFVIMGVALVYILLKMLIEERCGPVQDFSDAAMLNLLAFEREESVFDQFVKAGRAWSFSNAKIENDFDRYLRKGDIPHYVSTYVHGQDIDRLSYQSTLFVGKNHPPNIIP